MCMHGKFMLTQNVTVSGHYLSLCEVLLVSIFVSSAEGFLVSAFCHGGPLSTVGLACAFEWLNAMQVAIGDPGIILSFLYRGFKSWIYLIIIRITL